MEARIEAVGDDVLMALYNASKGWITELKLAVSGSDRDANNSST
ncbi:MAG: hypothetical protein AAGC95_09355 [Pseudomonadota bacterium]